MQHFYFIFTSHFSRSQLLNKIICSPRSIFFSLRVDPILEELHSPGKQTGSRKNCSTFVNDRKRLEVYPHTFSPVRMIMKLTKAMVNLLNVPVCVSKINF